MALPNTTVALERVDSNYLSADDFMMERDVLNEIVDGADEKNFLSFLEFTGRVEKSKSSTYYHYEAGLQYRSVGVATVVGGATTSRATITLTADSYTTVGSQTGSRDRSPLKATDVIMLPGGRHVYLSLKTDPTPTAGSAMNGVFGRGTPTGTATQYTLVRRNGDTYDLGAALTAMVGNANRMIAYTNAHAEGSYQPVEGMDALNTRYVGQMQHWKTVWTITGDADSDELMVPFKGSNKYASIGRANHTMKHQSDIGWAMLLSPGGSFTNEAGEAIPLTTGFEGYIRNLGNNMPYSASGGFTLADLNAIVGRIKANRGGKEYVWILGDVLYAAVENILRSFTSNGNISYNSFGKGSDKQRAIDLGFGSFTYNGITFHLMEEGLLNHQEVTGLAGMDYRSSGFLIPAGNQKVTFMDDNRETISRWIPSVRLRYKEDSRGSRRFREWTSDRTTNGGRDVYTHNLHSQQGLQMAMLHKFIRVYPQ